MSQACYLDPRGSRAETGYFTAATVPSEYCDCHVLVNYDTSTGAIAHEGCPANKVKQVGLLKVDRTFPANVKVTDTQYTWREVPEGTAMPETNDVPFYIGLYGEGEYPGYTDTTKRYYNSWCHEHKPVVEPEPEPEPAPGEDTEKKDPEKTDVTPA